MSNALRFCILLAFGLLSQLNAQNFYKRGLAEYYAGRDSVAAYLFEQAIKKHEKIVDSYVMLGATKLMMKKYNQAIESFKTALAFDSLNAKAYFYYARTYFLMGFNTTALSFYNKTLSIDPKYADALDDRAIINALSKNYSLAIEDENKAIKIDPKNDAFYITRGYCYLETQKYKDALCDFNKALSLSKSQKAFANRGYTYFLMNDFQSAIADFTSALDLLPNDGEILYRRGLAYKKNGEKLKACADFKRSIDLKYNMATSELHDCEK